MSALNQVRDDNELKGGALLCPIDIELNFGKQRVINVDIWFKLDFGSARGTYSDSPGRAEWTFPLPLSATFGRV